MSEYRPGRQPRDTDIEKLRGRNFRFTRPDYGELDVQDYDIVAEVSGEQLDVHEVSGDVTSVEFNGRTANVTINASSYHDFSERDTRLLEYVSENFYTSGRYAKGAAAVVGVATFAGIAHYLDRRQ